jgi:protein TonB
MLNLLLFAAAIPAHSAPAAEAPKAPAPQVGNLSMYFVARDYPPAALRRSEQGTVRFRVDISPEGRVSACTVTASSGSAILDETTCRLIQQRLRFRPARDREGKPATDSQEYRVTWVLP